MTKNVSIQEEVEAALNEGKAPLPMHLNSLLAEYNKINAEIAVLEKRKTEIKLIAGLEADQAGVTMFTVAGVNAFGFNISERRSADLNKLQAEFPEVAKAVIETKTISSFYAKK